MRWCAGLALLLAALAGRAGAERPNANAMLEKISEPGQFILSVISVHPYNGEVMLYFAVFDTFEECMEAARSALKTEAPTGAGCNLVEAHT